MRFLRLIAIIIAALFIAVRGYATPLSYEYYGNDFPLSITQTDPRGGYYSYGRVTANVTFDNTIPMDFTGTVTSDHFASETLTSSFESVYGFHSGLSTSGIGPGSDSNGFSQTITLQNGIPIGWSLIVFWNSDVILTAKNSSDFGTSDSATFSMYSDPTKVLYGYNSNNPGTWIPAPVPEPSTTLLLGPGLLGLAGLRRKFRK